MLQHIAMSPKSPIGQSLVHAAKHVETESKVELVKLNKRKSIRIHGSKENHADMSY